MDFAVAGALGTSWLTAYAMLFTKSGLRPGQTMFVQGCTSGVATALMQLGKAAGMFVWVVGRDAQKRAFALGLAADRAFAPDEALPGKVPAVFDITGKSWYHSMKWVAPGGTIVSFGITASETNFARLDFSKLAVDSITVRGNYLGTKIDFENLVRYVSSSGIKPCTGAILPLEKTKDGLAMLLEGKVKGKGVIGL